MTQHGGQESAILKFIATILPLGKNYVGDGSRQPSAVELKAARFQAAHIAEIAAKL
jgi:NAD(P)H dehydrogenase (quinone)